MIFPSYTPFFLISGYQSQMNHTYTPLFKKKAESTGQKQKKRGIHEQNERLYPASHKANCKPQS